MLSLLLLFNFGVVAYLHLREGRSVRAAFKGHTTARDKSLRIVLSWVVCFFIYSVWLFYGHVLDSTTLTSNRTLFYYRISLLYDFVSMGIFILLILPNVYVANAPRLTPKNVYRLVVRHEAIPLNYREAMRGWLPFFLIYIFIALLSGIIL